MSKPSPAEVLRRRADRLLEEAERLELLEAQRPEEPEYLEGRAPVVRFQKHFPTGVYDYAAVGFRRFPNQALPLSWCTTGPQSPKFQSWVELTNWLADTDDLETLEVLAGLEFV